jgi:hypothetical protein
MMAVRRVKSGEDEIGLSTVPNSASPRLQPMTRVGLGDWVAIIRARDDVAGAPMSVTAIEKRIMHAHQETNWRTSSVIENQYSAGTIPERTSIRSNSGTDGRIPCTVRPCRSP